MCRSPDLLQGARRHFDGAPQPREAIDRNRTAGGRVEARRRKSVSGSGRVPRAASDQSSARIARRRRYDFRARGAGLNSCRSRPWRLPVMCRQRRAVVAGMNRRLTVAVNDATAGSGRGASGCGGGTSRQTRGGRAGPCRGGIRSSRHGRAEFASVSIRRELLTVRKRIPRIIVSPQRKHGTTSSLARASG